MNVRYIKHVLNGSNKNINNHFVEIQAYIKGGANMALNKKVTSTIPPMGVSKPLEAIVDGKIISGEYVNTEGETEITVDLGQVYDIVLVKVWHFFDDGRRYKGNKVSVSYDGAHYEEHFNSDIDGEYIEIAEGKEVPMRGKYRPFIDITEKGNDLLIDLIPNGNTINSIDVYLRNKMVDTFNYEGKQLTLSPKDIDLAFGDNEFVFSVYYSGGDSLEVRHSKNYKQIELGTDNSLVESSKQIIRLGNTNERNHLSLVRELSNKGVDVSYNETMNELIKKISSIPLDKKWATGNTDVTDATSRTYRTLDGATCSYYRIQLANIGFKPSTVIYMNNRVDGGTFGLITSILNGMKVEHMMLVADRYSNGTVQTTVRNIKVDDSIIQSNGEINLLIASSAKLNHSWIAFE